MYTTKRNENECECAHRKKKKIENLDRAGIWGNSLLLPQRAAAHQTKIKIDSLLLIHLIDGNYNRKKNVRKIKNLIGKIELLLWLFWSGGQVQQIMGYKDNVFVFFFVDFLLRFEVVLL